MPDVQPFDLDAAQARIDTATLGPWLSKHGVATLPGHERSWHVNGPRRKAGGSLNEADAEFIASARTDLPHAVQILRHLRGLALGSSGYPQLSSYGWREEILRLTGDES